MIAADSSRSLYDQKYELESSCLLTNENTTQLEFPGYRILDRIGVGGQANVFRVEEEGTGEVYALKAPTNPGGADRLLRECKALGDLRGVDGVASIAGMEKGKRPFLVMEFIEGTDCFAKYGGTGAPPALAAQILLRVGRTVCAVHDQGWVHRDLSPDNIVLRDSDPRKPVLIDFGIARNTGTLSGLTEVGAVIGTKGYMSPEQLAGDEVGPPSDTYSIGCLFYFLLTGRPPFKGIFPREFPDRGDIPDLPAEFDSFFDDVTREKPDERPPLSESLRHLNRFLASGATQITEGDDETMATTVIPRPDTEHFVPFGLPPIDRTSQTLRDGAIHILPVKTDDPFGLSYLPELAGTDLKNVRLAYDESQGRLYLVSSVDYLRLVTQDGSKAVVEATKPPNQPLVISAFDGREFPDDLGLVYLSRRNGSAAYQCRISICDEFQFGACRIRAKAIHCDFRVNRVSVPALAELYIVAADQLNSESVENDE